MKEKSIEIDHRKDITVDFKIRIIEKGCSLS